MSKPYHGHSALRNRQVSKSKNKTLGIGMVEKRSIGIMYRFGIKMARMDAQSDPTQFWQQGRISLLQELSRCSSIKLTHKSMNSSSMLKHSTRSKYCTHNFQLPPEIRYRSHLRFQYGQL